MFMVCCDMQRHTQACESLRRPSGPRISVRSHQMAVFTGMAHERHSSREKLVYYSTPPGRSIRPAAITVRQVLLLLLTLTACCCTAISHTSVYSLYWTYSLHCQIANKNPSKRWIGEFWGFRICVGWISTTGFCVVGFYVHE